MVKVAKSGGRLVVSWDHDLSGHTDSFIVERRYAIGLVDWAQLTVVPATSQTHYSIVDSDDPGDGVQYRVQANGIAGTSDWAESDIYSAEVEEEGPSVPNAPTNVLATMGNMVRL